MHIHPTTKRIIPDKPGPNHDETLRVQRERKPRTSVRLECADFACGVVSDFEWTDKFIIDDYRKGNLNCPKCGSMYPKPRVKPGAFGMPKGFKQYASGPTSKFWPKRFA